MDSHRTYFESNVLSVNIQVVVFVYLIFEFPVKLIHSHDMWFVYDFYHFSIKNISDNGKNHQLVANITGLIFASLFRYITGHVHNDWFSLKNTCNSQKENINSM